MDNSPPCDRGVYPQSIGAPWANHWCETGWRQAMPCLTPRTESWVPVLFCKYIQYCMMLAALTVPGLFLIGYSLSPIHLDYTHCTLTLPTWTLPITLRSSPDPSKTCHVPHTTNYISRPSPSFPLLFSLARRKRKKKFTSRCLRYSESLGLLS